MRRLMVGLTAAVLLLPGKAFAFDLSGAWATDRNLCDHVFSKKGKEVSFTELSDLYGSGFIVNGDAIHGKSAKCSIKSRKQEGDTTTLSASCATSIMTGNYQFSYKVLDDNTLERLFPDIPNMALKFSRCPL
jgi:hypothetical protein